MKFFIVLVIILFASNLGWAYRAFEALGVAEGAVASLEESNEMLQNCLARGDMIMKIEPETMEI